MPFCGDSNDQVGNNNGTLIGPVLTNDRFGSNQNAYLFDGIDDYIDMNADIDWRNSDNSDWAYTESTEAMDVMGQFCQGEENDCQYDIRISLNGVQGDGGCGYEGLSFKSPAHFATAPFSSVSEVPQHVTALVHLI